jgi:hypothetical protein
VSASSFFRTDGASDKTLRSFAPLDGRGRLSPHLSRRDFFSRRVVAFHILIHQLDELGDDVVAL